MLNEREKIEMRKIMTHPASFGAFTGMIYNAHVTTGKPVEELLKAALQVRLIAQGLAK